MPTINVFPCSPQARQAIERVPFLKAGLGGHLSITNVLLGQGQLCARRTRKTQRKEGRESDARKKQYKTHVCITKLIT